MPDRIQLRRTKGWRMPPNTVSVARPTKWGNPFWVTSRHPIELEASVEYYRNWLNEPIQADLRNALSELRGKNLACWCPLDGKPCHADVLLELANR